jgi:prepilin-type N-terminal cleavage/methylation domain-containing protein/prepilin-type processing-associated H-X9-DG protein
MFLRPRPGICPRRGFTLIELLVVMAIIGILMALILPAVQAVREAARRTECLNHLKQVGTAVHNYESSLRRLPEGWRDLAVLAPGEPDMAYRYGWSTLILPFLEADNLYKSYNTRTGYWLNSVAAGDPADDFSTLLPVYTCASDPAPDLNTLYTESGGSVLPLAKLNYGGNPGIGDIGDQVTVYTGFAIDPDIEYVTATTATGSGEVNNMAFTNGLFCCNSRVRFKDLTDGQSNTVMFGERGGTDPMADDPIIPVPRHQSPNLLVRIGVPDSVDCTADVPPGAGIAGLGGDGAAQVSMGPMVNMSGALVNTAGNPYAPEDYLINSSTDLDEDGLNAYSSGYSSAHPTGANFAFADGSFRFISEGIDMSTLRQILQRNDGGTVDATSF